MKPRQVFVVLSALLLLSCQRFSNTPPDAKEEKMNSKVAAFTDGTEVILTLKDQQIAAASQKAAPGTFYITGVIENGRFMATSNVLGIGDLATSGRYGWLELNNREFFPMESDQRANTPFVKGYITPQGFIPSEREVFNTP